MGRYDIYTRFARRHLRTRTEQAVYLTLVSQEAETWSAAQIGARVRRPTRAVAQVLCAFEADRIVEAIETDHGRRYRWRSDMNYLFDQTTHATDPICGMHVAVESPYRTTDTNGQTWSFCSPVCLETFLTIGHCARQPSTTVVEPPCVTRTPWDSSSTKGTQTCAS